MDTDLEQFKEKILEADRFIRQLDETVRQEAFKLLMGTGEQDRPALARNHSAQSPEDSQNEEEGKTLQRIASEAQIPIGRLCEIFAVRNSVVEVVDSSIAHDGPVDLLRKIVLLCTYGNIIGKGVAKVDLSVVYENLRKLGAATTAYSRDVKRTDGIKVLSEGVVMLTPDGREKAKTLLVTILRLNME